MGQAVLWAEAEGLHEWYRVALLVAARMVRHTFDLRPRQILAASCATPLTEGKIILGVIYGVLLWAVVNAATPRGRGGAL